MQIGQQEKPLLDLVHRLDKHRAGRRAIHLQLSRLGRRFKQDHFSRTSAGYFHDLIRTRQGQLFRLANYDLVFICSGATVFEIDNVVLKLRYLFRDDLFIQLVENETAETKFCDWFDLENDYVRFRTAIDQLTKTSMAMALQQTTQIFESVSGPLPKRKRPLVPLDVSTLARLEPALGTMDFTTLMGRQLIFASVAGKPPKPVFQEIFTSREKLQRRVCPGVDLEANPWLFQHLTTTLDRRLISAFCDNPPDINLPINFNVTLATLTAADFPEYLDKLSRSVKHPLIWDINILDALNDIDKFLFCQNDLHLKGQKICLSGMDAYLYGFLDRSRLQSDFEKVTWDAKSTLEMDRDWQHAFARAVKNTTSTHVILSHCDGADALAFGKQMGIHLFQGHYLDELAQRHQAA